MKNKRVMSVPISAFTYIKKDPSLVTEASSIAQFSHSEVLKIVGKGWAEKFTYESVELDREGDVVKWVFRPVSPLSLIKFVYVFND